MKISGKFVRNFRYCYQSSILFKEFNFIKSSLAQEQNILSSKGMIYKNRDMINEPIYLSHVVFKIQIFFSVIRILNMPK